MREPKKKTQATTRHTNQFYINHDVVTVNCGLYFGRGILQKP